MVFNGQNRLRFVYTHFKSCDQSLDKTSLDFSYIFLSMKSRALSANNSIMLKLPETLDLSRLGLWL